MATRQVRQTERIRPGRTAQRYLIREWGMCRHVWNQLVEQSQDRHLWNHVAYANAGGELAWDDLPTFGYAEQDKFLSRLRQTTTDPVTGVHWLAEGSSVVQQQTVRDFASARSKAMRDRKDTSLAMARKRGLPRWKSRTRDLPSMNYTRRGFSLVQVDGVLRLRLPKQIDIPVVWTRDLPSDPRSARVYQDSLGHWYVSFVVEVDVAAAHLAEVGDERALGVDWGVAETATTVAIDTATREVDESDTYDLPHAQHGKRAAQRLARYQRMMARRRQPKGQPQTKGYQRAKARGAKAHKKVARQRQDDARKWARRVVQDHDRIGVEDFKPKFLAKNRSTSRKAADAAIAQTKAELVWQAVKAGRDLRLINPKNTTTDCYACGARTKHRLPLGERTYTCEDCGMVRPRDKNSAAVMVARAGFVPADVEGVSPEPAAVREPAA